ncbi:hypothetical protein PHAVU_005G093100 [Phaseolus vulgaris]|uniref:START domain-containing protein n=1 Tax=Phaseolus vulgaris TaxID=3885 RepID=V7BXC2_PHAVU|nr:hypothetical protein PHAVU_005G093100g [Phaseolus vulgaris]ESW21708.1 hypothetical protein PHAVU_005G093100g [Phaseolus vulgaris]
MSIDRASDLLLGFSIYTEPIRTGIIEHAFCGMDELSKIGIAGHPLWQRETNNGCEILNNIEYLRQFGEVDTTLREIVKLMEVGESQNLPSFDTHQTELPTSTVTPTVTPHTQTEGSRDIAYINMAPICIVELLMDVNQWSEVFYNIVSKATIVGTLVGTEGSYDNKLHVNTSLTFFIPMLVRVLSGFSPLSKTSSMQNKASVRNA